MEKQPFEINKMSVEDVPSVFEIERKGFSSSSWSKDAFYHEIEKNEFAHYFVVKTENKVVGYCGLWIVIDQAQITTIAVDEEYRNLGIGTLLLQYAINYAKLTCTVMSLEVRVDNWSAKHIYEKVGFSYGGLRKNYYGNGEDAEVMWVNL